ncbi:type II/IV secretion system protein [Patescibacteria group bacterium]|nr:type II/IV secretion system protein [Patescibacteria group bacterium]
MQLDDKALAEILLKGNYISAEDFKTAQDFASKKHGTVLDYFFSAGLLNRDLLGQAIAESMNLLYSDLNTNIPSATQIAKIPLELAQKYRLVLFAENKDALVVTSDDPQANGILEALATVFPGRKIALTYSLSEDIDAILNQYRKPLETRFSKIIAEQKRIAPEIIEEILSDAISYHASDIHFEPRKTDVIVRFRVDGVLQEAGSLPKEHYENILNRIKVQSRLRIDEHYAAQDGSMHYEKENLVVDFRTSIIPIVEGEKVVLRVLSSYLQALNLSELGLSDRSQNIVLTAADKPFGMILVVGPTGSGKTTTLYALLKILNKADVNITTIEDPVEYKVHGLNQIQVNVQTNLTFAKGLRSIVRQDPDIILVGEIRDEETAEIAVNAALTGHLLLSTFHANDAATAIPRLLDMGIEPFLLASTLEVIIAQRLVRKICDNCRYSFVIPKEKINLNSSLKDKYFTGTEITLYKGKGCSVCGHTGYKGRAAIFEFINMTPTLQDLVLKNPASQQIWELAQLEGSLSLFEDGLEKVKNGLTTLEELLRVAQAPK